MCAGILTLLERDGSDWHSDGMKWLPALILLTGCAQVMTPDSPPAETVSTPTSTPMAVGTLEDLLSAEISLNRGQTQQAYERLARQAKINKSATLALRAARIATALQPETALEAAKALATYNENYETLAILARAYLINDQVQPAVEYLRQTAKMQPDQVLGFLPRLLRAGPAWAGELADALTDIYADDPSLAIGVPYLYATEADAGPEAALPIALALAKRTPDRPSLFAEAARLAQQAGDNEAAIETLQTGVKRYPDNESLLLTLTQLWVANEQYALAIEGFAELNRLNPEQASYRASQALLAVEIDDLDLAGQLGNELRTLPETELEGLLVLGLVATAQGQLDQGRKLLADIEGERFMLARTQLAQAYADAKDFDALARWMSQGRQIRPDLSTAIYLTETEILDDAQQPERLLALLNQAIEQTPDEFQLLYARALYRDAEQVVAIEQDLLDALALEPDNASALNALGYTYADANIKLDQALELIGRALAMRPDDSAILDSMGWVHFRLGNLSQALSWLSRAYERFPDPEIAAHYGEVLFVDGQTEKALEVFRQAVSNEESHPIVDETLERLGIDL